MKAGESMLKIYIEKVMLEMNDEVWKVGSL